MFHIIPLEGLVAAFWKKNAQPSRPAIQEHALECACELLLAIGGVLRGG